MELPLLYRTEVASYSVWFMYLYLREIAAKDVAESAREAADFAAWRGGPDA